MIYRVLVFQTTVASAKTLADYFNRRGDQTWQATNTSQFITLLNKEKPDLVIVDLHTPGNEWLRIISHIRDRYPQTRVIVTNRYPDVWREFIARGQGIHVFLREPFTPTWIERALKKLEVEPREARAGRSVPGALPRVRVSMRLKVTLPYALLALMFALAAAYLISRFSMESLHERYTSQLIDAAKLSADWMVQEENRIMRSLRQLSNTAGVPEAITSRNPERLRELALPLAINQQEESVIFLDNNGYSLLSINAPAGGGIAEINFTQGDKNYANLSFVQKVLQKQIDQKGDKFMGLANTVGKRYFYIAGPVIDAVGTLVGEVLVGKSLDTLVQQNRQDTLAQVSIYDLGGSVVASTLLDQNNLPPVSKDVIQDVLMRQDTESTFRDLTISGTREQNTGIRNLNLGSIDYSELLAPWEARGGEDLGVIGVALAQNYLIRPTFLTSLQTILIVALAFTGVIAVGLLVAGQITQPLSKIVHASTKVAQGNLDIRVPSEGNDEVAVLAHAFNYMISGLQEGFIYRDLLGRTVSPEVREALRRSFASGNLKLEGQSTVATVLISDIRGFTTISERVEPTTILNWLNEYFGELVPVVTSHTGVVDKFEGDAMLAFFGILPTPLSPEQSAYQACKTSLDILQVIKKINERRFRRSEPPLVTGIGINTGTLIAGGLGTADRLNYTIIGDTVNTTQRMQELTRNFGESGVVISENTLTALKEKRSEFRFEPLGEHSFSGKLELMWLYRLLPLDEAKRNPQVVIVD